MKSLKNPIYFFLLLAPLLILSDQALAGLSNSGAGTSVFNFLKIEVAARPTAMGGAFTGLADDEASLFYNPAGIVELDGRRFILGYHNNVFDMQSGFLGYLQPLGQGKAAAYINYLNYGDFIRTNAAGEEMGTFSGGDILFAAGYASSVSSYVHIGGVAKFIYEKIDCYSSTGVAVDLGVKWFLKNGRTTLGLMVQNIGAQLSGFTSSSSKDPLPLNLRGGFSSRLRGLPLLIAGDVVMPSDNDIYFALGTEYLNLKPLFLRLGWTMFGSNYKTHSSKDNLAGFSAGLGIEYKRIQISYALSPQAELGTSHRITLTGGID
ncbi:MAG: PorV/PorQ family protein [candidate division Zixibacteria bacterium]|nr:PorV/PorQ family protein [candidate division Zixibacteria bacterium]